MNGKLLCAITECISQVAQGYNIMYFNTNGCTTPFDADSGEKSKKSENMFIDHRKRTENPSTKTSRRDGKSSTYIQNMDRRSHSVRTKNVYQTYCYYRITRLGLFQYMIDTEIMCAQHKALTQWHCDSWGLKTKPKYAYIIIYITLRVIDIRPRQARHSRERFNIRFGNRLNLP